MYFNVTLIIKGCANVKTVWKSLGMTVARSEGNRNLKEANTRLYFCWRCSANFVNMLFQHKDAGKTTYLFSTYFAAVGALFGFAVSNLTVVGPIER